MAFYRKKKVKGNEYLYKVKSKRNGNKVMQIILYYFGRADKFRKVVNK